MKNALKTNGWVYNPLAKEWVHFKTGRRIPIISGGGKAVTVQGAFWFRNNDGNEAAATFMGAQGSDQSLPTGSGNIFRLRVVVEETAGGTLPVAAGMQVSYNSGAYNDITGASTYVVAADESQGIADDVSLTTQRLTYSGTFVSGRYDDDGADTTGVSLTSTFTEYEFSMYVVTADVSNGNTLDFRVYQGGSALDTYSVTPRLTVLDTVTRIPRRGFTNFQVPGII